MKEHLKRRIKNAEGLLPDESTEEFKTFKNSYDKKIAENPAMKKKLKETFNKAVNTLHVQDLNGIGLNMDHELRHFLNEFNYRSWNFGHRSMPIMFNIMEAFFDLDKSLNSWKLLDEEDYLISFYHFLDFYTSEDISYELNSIIDNFEENLIYNYNVGSDIKNITFKTVDGNEFVIAGVSLLRRGNEVTMLFLTGEIIDTKLKTSELIPISKSNIPGKENITPAKDRTQEAVMLNNNPNLWKVLIACRFDLEAETIDARYVAKDEGNNFSITTDDITGFLRGGEWINLELKETFEGMMTKIEKYNSIFELAKAVLYLPYYFNRFEENISEEEHETKVKSLITNPIQKKKYLNVDPKYKIRIRSLWLLNAEERFSADRVILRDDKFKIETGGYWKELAPDEFGTDKKNRQITGKTWVNKTESYYQAKTDDLIISKNVEEKIFEGDKAGYIYIMRNPTFENNIFKIGLTTNTTNERTKQLSKTSVPDRFYVMRQWNVKDCSQAEKLIHDLLKSYRIDLRREFFKVDMKVANQVIESVIESINNQE